MIIRGKNRKLSPIQEASSAVIDKCSFGLLAGLRPVKAGMIMVGRFNTIAIFSSVIPFAKDANALNLLMFFFVLFHKCQFRQLKFERAEITIPVKNDYEKNDFYFPRSPSLSVVDVTF